MGAPVAIGAVEEAGGGCCNVIWLWFSSLLFPKKAIDEEAAAIYIYIVDRETNSSTILFNSHSLLATGPLET